MNSGYAFMHLLQLLSMLLSLYVYVIRVRWMKGGGNWREINLVTGSVFCVIVYTLKTISLDSFM